jgi:hypothetical protein
VVRDGDDTVWQVGDFVRVHDATGKEQLRREGSLLARCPDGGVLAWRRAGGSPATRWEIFEARHDVLRRTVARAPSFVLGVDPACKRLFLQSLEGGLAAVDVRGGSPAEPATPTSLAAPGGAFVLDGYAHEVRPSAARDARGAGLWLAFSGGALVRLDDGGIEPYGHASPRATALADGPEAGDLLFADDRGVVLRAAGRADRLVLPAQGDRVWDDIALLPGGHRALLAWAHGVVVLDLDRGEIAGELPTPHRGRLTPWDAEGSLLVWSWAFMGQPQGEVIPFGPPLARQVSEVASNLRASIAPDRRILIDLADR